MANIEYNIFKTQPEGLSGFRSLSNEDTQLLTSAEVVKTFKPNDNFIELSFFTLDNIILQTIPNYTNYSVVSGDTVDGQEGNTEIGIDVQEDVLSYGYQGQEVKALYNFLDYPYSNSTNPQDFYIESISPDRTEVRLVSVNLGGSNVLDTTNNLIDQFNNQAFSPDIHLYFGNNIFYSIINIDVEEFRDTNAVLLKLYNPLPSAVNVKARVNIVEKVSDSIAFEINTKITPDEPVIPRLRGANFDIEIETQATEPSQYFNYNELFSFPTTNTYRELNSLFNEKGAELGIDYSDFSNFINFSSAEERLRNFKYKLELLNSYQTQLDIIDNPGFTYTGEGSQQSSQYYKNLIEGIINNFDHYERHLFYEKGDTSWPKSNTTRPYDNLPTTNAAALTWYAAELEDAILYDAQNPDLLTNTIASYLKEDTDNRPYELFVHMIAQHFDNIWLYTDSVTKKYDADNKLNRGVSKDLVEDLLKNFGIKLYTSNRSAQDLFKYFTINSYDSTGESVTTITEGEPVSQNNYQKEIYKRIYHNLPLLMKSKGTERGLRALINCFGIPSDTLKIRVYGGQSSEELPFFGGEQPFTGSIDKVRLSNTGSIVEGDTLSQYTSIIKPANYYTQDLHSIEVGFSPTHNINEYILSQSAVLFPNDPIDIDQYIGDPRETQTNRYIGLREYANQIFDGVTRYDLKDFVRLIKFFDNVIFRMVRDFIPARAVADTGIIIKPHLLERNKQVAPVMSWTQPEYSGSIDTTFISGSHGGAYKSVGYGAVSSSKFDGESSTSYKELVVTPSGSKYKSWTRQSSTISPGYTRYDRSQDQAKFDGQLSGSRIQISDGELNRDNPFKQLDYSTVKYNVAFYKDLPVSICIIQPGGNPFIVRPEDGPIWNLSSFFQYCNNTDFNYTLAGTQVDPNQEASYAIDETLLTQYNTFNVVATKNIDPTCTQTTEVAVVRCNMETVTSNVPAFINTNTEYQIQNWFNQNANTDSSIFVNGTLVSTFPYTFTQNNGDEVEITLRDNIDPTCFRSIFVEVNDCTLSAKQFFTLNTFIDLPELGVTQTVLDGWPITKVQQVYENAGNDFLYYEISVPDLFNGTNEETEYKLFIQYTDPATQTPQYTDPLNIIPSPYPGPGINGTVFDGIDGPLTVPSSRTELYNRYYDSLPDSITNSYSNITGLTENYLLSWYVQASQPILTGCIANSVTQAVSDTQQDVLDERVARFYRYVTTGGGQDVLCASGIQNKTVYINPENSSKSAQQIMVQNIKIYNSANPTDPTPADFGYYKSPDFSNTEVYNWDGVSTWTLTYDCANNTGLNQGPNDNFDLDNNPGGPLP